MATRLAPSKPRKRKARPSVYRLTYSNPRADSPPLLFQCRDAMAFLELTAPLYDKGFGFGTTLYLYPGDEKTAWNDYGISVSPRDLLVLTTRPPLHDLAGLHKPRRIIQPARSKLEQIFFAVLARFFLLCTRSHVTLTEQALQHLSSEIAAYWRDLQIYQYNWLAEIQAHVVDDEKKRRRPKGHASSVAFFLRIDRLEPLNCAFIASFGMNGMTTLMWNTYIRRHHPEWLLKEQFQVAELQYMVKQDQFPERPLTPAFLDNPNLVRVNLLTSG